MANRGINVVLSARDRDVLGLLDRTPATTALILKASEAFDGGPFRDERRVRERMQNLGNAGLVRRWPLALPGGGATNYYKLSVTGFRLLYGENAPRLHNRYFAAVPLARLEHTHTLAQVIVHTLVTAHRHRIRITKFYRENSRTLQAGPIQQQPDCMVQLSTGGRTFNVLFEVDNSTESIDSPVHQSIRRKVLGYEAYQDRILNAWKASGRKGLRPVFRAVFLTRTIDRAHHILFLVSQLAGNMHRRLCYAATQDAYLAENDALRDPIFLDHSGSWQALADIHPSAPFPRPPVRIRAPLASQFPIGSADTLPAFC